MSDNTKISWANATWSPIIGCSKISSGCKHCYAEKMACRLAYMGNRSYREVVFGILSRKDDPGEVICYDHWFGNTFFVESALTKPLRWKKPRNIFVNSMGDTWHKSVPFEWIDRIMAVAALCPQHTFLFLTKRAERMREYRQWLGDWNAKPILHQKDRYGGDRGEHGEKLVNSMFRIIDKYNLRRSNYSTLGGIEQLLSNVHLGVTVENQDNVGRIADLIRTPAAKRFLSIEPLLEDVSMPAGKLEQIDSAFIGCESGTNARLCTLRDIRIMMSQCRDAGVKVHVKQIPLDGKCNKNFDEWPPEFQVREI